MSVLTTAALAILLTLFYLLTGGTLLEQKATIYLYVPDATGLDKDAPVQVNGIDVGKVAKVELSGETVPNRIVKIIMTVERERLESITADAVAEISSDSLIGDKYVAITSKTSTAARIPPNGEIRLKPSSELAKSLDLPQFEAQLRSIDALLADIEQGKSTVGQFVFGDQIYTSLLGSVGKIENAFHAAVSSTSVLGQALYTDQLYQQIAGPMVKLDQTLAQMQSGQGSVGPLLRDTAQYESALKQVQDLRASISQAGAGEWMQSDRMYRDWDHTIVSFIQQVDRMNADPLMDSTAVYEGLNGVVRETGNTVKNFRSDPRKYLRLKLF